MIKSLTDWVWRHPLLPRTGYCTLGRLVLEIFFSLLFYFPRENVGMASICINTSNTLFVHGWKLCIIAIAKFELITEQCLKIWSWFLLNYVSDFNVSSMLTNKTVITNVLVYNLSIPTDHIQVLAHSSINVKQVRNLFIGCENKKYYILWNINLRPF